MNNYQLVSDIIQNPYNGTPPIPYVENADLVAQEELMHIHNGLCTVMYNKARQGVPIRVAMYNLYSSNNFQNQQYAAMLDRALEYYSCLKMLNGGAADIGKVIEEVVAVELPIFVTDNRGAESLIPNDQVAHNDFNRYRDMFKDISNIINQAMNINQQRGGYPQQGGYPPQGDYPQQGGYPPQGGYPQQGYHDQPQGYPQQGGYPQPQRGGYPQQQGGSYPQQGYMGHPQSMGRPGGHGGHNNFQQSQGPRQRPRNGVGGVANGSRGNNNANMLASRRPSPNNNIPSHPSSSRYAPRHNVTTQNHQRHQDNSDAMFDTSGVHSTNPNRRFNTRPLTKQNDNYNPGDDNMETFDETTRDLATMQREIELDDHLNNMSDGFKLEYHSRLPAVSKDQVVIKRGDQFIVLSKENTMDYSDHETDGRMLQLSKNKVVQPPVLEDESKWPLMSRPDKVDIGGEHGKVDELESESIIFSGDVKAASIEESIGNCYIALMDEFNDDESTDKAEFFNSNIVEFYPKFTTPVVGVTDNDLSLIKDVRNTRSLREMVSMVRDHASKMTSHVWYMLEHRLTDVTNRRLKSYSKVDVSIDSIVDDYDDVFEALGQFHPVESLENFKQNLMAELKKACIIKGYTDGESDEPEDIHEFHTKAAVVRLPWTSSSMDLKLPEDGSAAMLSQSVTSEILTACLSVVNRTTDGEDKDSTSRRFLVTHDNVVIEIHMGDFGVASVLLSLYQGETL